MKYRLFVIFGGVIVTAFVLFLVAAWPYRGFVPILRQPPVELAEVIDRIESRPSDGDDAPMPARNDTEFPLALPEGFSISVFARDLQAPRVLREGPDRVLFASIPAQGRIVALPDRDGDGRADEVVTVASGLNRPHGFFFREADGWELYVAETDALVVLSYDPKTLRATGRRVLRSLPTGGRHWTRTIMPYRVPGGEERILISIGSACDVCHEEDERRGTIQSTRFDGTDLKPFATGLRNAVFMTTHPVTGDVWVTEMGRDFLGDDLPPDEINIVEEGKNYGWPICYGKNVHDTQFDKNTYIRNPCMEPFETPSHIDLPAHSAPLGLAFVPADAGWPEAYHYDMIVAFHGSWNRSVPTGYKLYRYHLDERGAYLGEEDFLAGWLREDRAVLGRPADLVVASDGAMYVSDDHIGVVYRITPPTP